MKTKSIAFLLLAVIILSFFCSCSKKLQTDDDDGRDDYVNENDFLGSYISKDKYITALSIKSDKCLLSPSGIYTILYSGEYKISGNILDVIITDPLEEKQSNFRFRIDGTNLIYIAEGSNDNISGYHPPLPDGVVLEKVQPDDYTTTNTFFAH